MTGSKNCYLSSGAVIATFLESLYYIGFCHAKERMAIYLSEVDISP